MPAPAAAVTAARVGALAWSERRGLIWGLVAALGLPLALGAVIAALVGGLAGGLDSAPPGDGFAPSPAALADVPPRYLQSYQAAGASSGVGWEYLAAIGKVESDHGRSTAPGVRSGTNAYGCCAGPMQICVIDGCPAGGPHALGVREAQAGTWRTVGVDANGDGEKNPWDPQDAIPAAARLLKDAGAPGDYRQAIFAYNHASWYVDEVMTLAERYRGAAQAAGGTPAGSANSQRLPDGRPWLAPVPGTSATCDARIVPDVQLLVQRYRLTVTACFALTGHKRAGEHPLGLATDLVPGAGGSWALLGRLARELGWRESCAGTGCAGLLPSPMRFIGWNGYEGHGDPAHAGANAHLHLSWAHTPAAFGTRAERVQTLLPRPGGDTP